MYTITTAQWSFKKIAEEMKKGNIDFKGIRKDLTD